MARLFFVVLLSRHGGVSWKVSLRRCLVESFAPAVSRGKFRSSLFKGLPEPPRSAVAARTRRNLLFGVSFFAKRKSRSELQLSAAK